MDDNETTAEELFDRIPAEVQGYIYSDNFSKNLAGLLNRFSLSEEDKKVITGNVYGYIATSSTEAEALENIKKIIPDQEKQLAFTQWFQEHVTDKIIALATDAYIHEEDTAEKPLTSSIKPVAIITTAPSPSDVLKNIEERLVTPVVVAPKTGEQPAAKPVVSGIKKIDPYREGVE